VTGAATPVLEVEDIVVSFSGRKILDDVSFEIRQGEFTGLIGSNGVGKTTLLRVVLGLQRPDAGRVRVLGAPLSGRGRSLGYVPQKVVLDPNGAHPGPRSCGPGLGRPALRLLATH
jgi:zinc/manganese transport system ATP-binding protein